VNFLIKLVIDLFYPLFDGSDLTLALTRRWGFDEPLKIVSGCS